MLLRLPDVPIYRAGPQPEGPFHVPDAPNNRGGPEAREPSECLNGQSYGERLAKEAFCLPGTRGLQRDSVGPSLLQWRQSVSLHTWRCQGPRKPSSCATPPSALTGAELPQAKKMLCAYAQARFGSVRLMVPWWTATCQASLTVSGAL